MKSAIPVLCLVLSVSSVGFGQGSGGCPGVGDTIQINGPSYSTAVAFLDDLAVTYDVSGFTTWDLRDPLNPVVLGGHVAERGHNAYLPTPLDLYLHPDGWALTVPWFGVYDLRHPAHPEPIEWDIGPTPSVDIDDGDPWKGVAVRDDLIAASHLHGAIWLLDLSEEPLPPWTTPSWPGLPSWVDDLAFVDDYLVVLGRLGEIVVYDVTDLQAPTVVGSGGHDELTPGWSLYGGAGRALALRRLNTFFIDYPLDVVAIDLTDPTNPVSYDVTGDVAWYAVYSVRLMGTKGVIVAYPWAFGDTQSKLYEIDLSDPANPTIVTTRDSFFGGVMAIDQDRVVKPSYSRMAVYEREEGFPLVGESATEGEADDLDIDGSLGVVANGYAGLVVFDLTDPASPVELSRLDVGGWAEEVQITGSTAVVLVADHALVMVGLTDPASPEILGFYPLDSWSTTTEHLAVDGNLAMVTEGSYGRESSFLVIDISNPSQLVAHTGASIGPDARNDTAAHLSGTIVLTSYGGSLRTYDASNHPPILLDSLELAPFGEIYSTAVIGDTAFAATGYDLFAIDIHDPTALAQIESFDSMLSSRVGATGTGLLAIASSDGTYLADVSDPSAPIFYPTPRPLRWWESGRIIGNTWLRPSGPYLDIMSLECRAAEADFRWWGLGMRITFENLSRYPVTDSSWDFGDGSGSTSSGNTVNHSYDQMGRYTVTLDVIGSDGTDSISKTIGVGTRVFFDDFETRGTIGWDGWKPSVRE